jgi:hypothetical protein
MDERKEVPPHVRVTKSGARHVDFGMLVKSEQFQKDMAVIRKMVSRDGYSNQNNTMQLPSGNELATGAASLKE